MACADGGVKKKSKVKKQSASRSSLAGGPVPRYLAGPRITRENNLPSMPVVQDKTTRPVAVVHCDLQDST